MPAVAAQAAQHVRLAGCRRHGVVDPETPLSAFWVEAVDAQQGRGDSDRQQCHPDIFSPATDNSR
ncbi:hypothetical protein GCM10018980_18740 [Streptomyces capoamus]|uniref:Uncharacterized protein n=1 Tax=Streptomyces capoamus TaxID=68183 RepID=A0A919C529_9ACTN|nr:hypothetical protein GCM10010501_32340 [Streptomyces libani subsp. rufus]GHG42657.1 hypothetical protein GCM10018980_18740 [Streptomyces capoamus]